MVVVHQTCYKRELYENDLDDDQPWFCARCQYIRDNEPSKLNIPNCFLCPDLKGALVDLETKEWVHLVCVNWHNDIWFETQDTQ